MSYSPRRPTKELSLNRSKLAWDLRVKGWSQEKIANELGVSQSAISKMLLKSTKKFSEAYLLDIKNVKNEQIAQLEYVAYQAIVAWDSSRDAAEFDPRFLQIFMQAKEHIRKIIGADAPVKLETKGTADIVGASTITVYIPDNGRNDRD